MAPLVSILIPCFNGAPFIKACLQSCFLQSYSDLEIFLIDNNSTDDSIAIAEKEAHRAKKRITVVECRKQGLKHARSYGNRIAKGKYVQFLDADDQLGPEKIASQVAALEKQPQFTLAYSDWLWRFHYPDGKKFEVTFQSTQIDDYLAQLLINNWRPPHTYLMHRKVVDRVDPSYSLDSGNTSSEDREFFTLAALLGHKFLHVPETYVVYNNWSTQQISKKVNYLEKVKNLARVFNRFNECAAGLPRDSLTRLHWWLLKLSRKPWHILPGHIGGETGSKFFKAKHAPGKPIKISPLEAILISAIQQYNEPRLLEHHAFAVLRILLMQKFKKQQSVSEAVDPLQFIQQTAGLLAADNNSRNLISEDALQDVQVLSAPHDLAISFLLKGPLFMPLLGIQRLQILGTLENLCDKEILVEV